MSTYLIIAAHDQKIATVEQVEKGDILAYSNPAWYQSRSLGRDYGNIEVGDQVVLCRVSQLKFVACVDEIVMAIDASGSQFDGAPVRILKGDVIGRFDRFSVAVFAHQLEAAGVDIPVIISDRLNGFKQGAFAAKLDKKQAEICLARAEFR